MGQKFNESWSPGDGGGTRGGGSAGDVYDEVEEAHRSARPVSSAAGAYTRSRSSST